VEGPRARFVLTVKKLTDGHLAFYCLIYFWTDSTTIRRYLGCVHKRDSQFFKKYCFLIGWKKIG